MIPSIICRQLNKGLREYIKTTFPVSNRFFKGSVDHIVEHGNLFKPPFFSVRMPFQVSDSDNRWFDGVNLGFNPFIHQELSFDRLCGETPRSTLVATGTGSGKTECFLYPILEYCYQNRGEPGIKAIIIYPMNALATDQANRIARLIYNTPLLKNDVSAGMYIGDRSGISSTGMSADSLITDRETMRRNPPDILLTNYKMLDYLLTRPDDRDLWEDNKPSTLRFIAVDEFHTFDGAQGTDLACLVRRLKKRLETPKDYLCCVGTSATMGSKSSEVEMLGFAQSVFGEPFETDGVITEKRMSTDAFLEGISVDYTRIPSKGDLRELASTLEAGDEKAFIQKAFEAWFEVSEAAGGTVLVASSLATRTVPPAVTLAENLKRHFFFRELVGVVESGTLDYDLFIAKLEKRNRMLEHYPMELKYLMVDSLLCLVSYARTRDESGGPGRFLDVHVQLWFREMRRVVASVGDEPKLHLSDDLNAAQMRDKLPVINCRDCGATGWVSKRNDDGFVRLGTLRDFYIDYFNADPDICILYPVDDFPDDMNPQNQYYLCPDCLKLNQKSYCTECGNDSQLKVHYERPFADRDSGNHRIKCPICSSEGGTTFIGARNSTLISAGISEIFASRFNDDKKLLAFSDSVQDAAHKAGFFNARTWRFNFRVALQQYVQEKGSGQNLRAFLDGFCDYYASKMKPEDFAATFIAPNQKWRRAFEHLLEHDTLPSDGAQVQALMESIKKRMKLEALYEYGFRCRIGRTLEKSDASILTFSGQDLEVVLKSVYEQLINELGAFRKVDYRAFKQFVYGFLTRLKNNGGIVYGDLIPFIKREGNPYFLSQAQYKWMPGQIKSGKIPDFLEMSVVGNPKGNFTNLKKTSWYSRWAQKTLLKPFVSETLVNNTLVHDLYRMLVDVLEQSKILLKIDSDRHNEVVGLNPGKLFVSEEVAQIRCNSCGNALSIPADDLETWLGMPCRQQACTMTVKPVRSCAQEQNLMGVYEQYGNTSNFFGRLYANGEIKRIFAAEHTGLLSRKDREAIEQKFKVDRKVQKSWNINLLSCTPTLELGIDIGDLSSIILCSVPPSQARFLQRVGRPGRREGNAFSTVVSNIKTHDMYFFEEPYEMIAGDVKPPHVFLDASAILERQFLAFCFDCWIKSGSEKKGIPKDLSRVLSNIEKPEKRVFPHNLLEYIKVHLKALFTDFCFLFGYENEMTSSEIEKETVDKLRAFAEGDSLKEGSINFKLVRAFEKIKEERESVKAQLKRLNQLIKAQEKKPDDSRKDENLNSFKLEKQSLARVVTEINRKNVYNFLSDEGLLPNYAFPESGITLKAVIYRDVAPDENKGGKKKYEHYVYEYMRPAASAISEFAPRNAFYSGGRKMEIDQIDVNVSKPELWRLCPDCSHAELSSEITNTRTCPRCGSAAWREMNQENMMLRLRQVYATDEYKRSFSADENDDRDFRFYRKDLYVDVDPGKITDAYQIDDSEQPFGFEFVKKATLREINFGEKRSNGLPLTVAGEEEVRNGFTICKYCGKVQNDNPGAQSKKHYYSCPQYNSSSPADYEVEVFLYRDFESEILRILIPATTLQLDDVVEHSFIAAVMLGLKGYFGTVDHLRATISQEPVVGSEYRKNYLVLYDTVPGGTGYLKHLMKEPGAVFDMLQKAVDVMENCSCESNPEHDGCYRCLFAYKLSRFQNAISKQEALRILRGILKNRDKIERINTIDDIVLTSLFDSELEKMFIEGLKRFSSSDQPVELEPAIHNMQEGFKLTIGNKRHYFITQQVMLSQSEGVAVDTRADFLIESLDRNVKETFKPVVIYTDGFSFHKKSVGDDFLKRMAVVRSGRYRVWNLSYEDVNSAFEHQGAYCPDFFYLNHHEKKVFRQLAHKTEVSTPDDILDKNAFEMLFEWLANPGMSVDFEHFAFINSFLHSMKKNVKWSDLYNVIDGNPLFSFTDSGDSQFEIDEEVMTGSPDLRLKYATLYFLLRKKDVPDRVSRILCVIDDEAYDQDGFKNEWNGFLRAFNLFQFLESCFFVTKSGIKEGIYGPLLSHDIQYERDDPSATRQEDNWEAILEDVIGDEVRAFAESLKEKGYDPPDELGFELFDGNGEIVAEAELFWRDEKRVLLRPDQRHYEAVFEGKGYETLVV